MASSNKTHWLLHVLFIFIACSTILPIILVFMVSITDETTIAQNGYSFLPQKISFEAYRYLFLDSMTIIRAYGVTIFITVVGTLGGLLLTALLAYPISRKDFPYKNGLTFFVFFTMLFNGGLVPWYLVFTKLIPLKDTVWSLVIPGLLLNGFFVLIMRTFFATSIPMAIIESAYMDGASESKIFVQIVIPLSTPVLATVGLFNTLAYWNDWFNSLVFLSNSKLYSLQYLLNKILLNIQFLAQNSRNTNAAQLMATLPTETVRMAMAIIGIGPIVLAYPFFQKYFVKGLTVGAVKG
ncbi:carbohydrate ABC transporter permease [Paenibacillus hexagrammi]|uniref:Carbohydrate ABC transporter permease n=1 Tax=Paenibacillus hexagrammi TaxID=2908839 RepID=A0ABY3SM59_9BACL|nr:carbohydrate ABC transporter permease [Paenibacillus sp. YPD9-1]UJF34968.1 carbohydrate ABC transporter permease [Paenibacillus sp. YPD9-1]